MCDPISIGLVVAGTALQSYGQSQVAGAQKRDIIKSGQDYEAERARQADFTKRQEGTVADTLNTYSRPASDQRMADATAARQAAYTSPLEAKSFVADTPADFDPNNVVANRNAMTGRNQQAKSIAEALAKAKLDAYGDAQTRGNIMSNNNANAIAMVQRQARGSAQAGNIQQGTLQSKMEADKGAGATAGTIGDLFTMAGMLGAGGGLKTLGGKLFGFSNPLAAGTVGSGFGGTSLAGTGVLY